MKCAKENVLMYVRRVFIKSVCACMCACMCARCACVCVCLHICACGM